MKSIEFLNLKDNYVNDKWVIHLLKFKWLKILEINNIS